MLDPARDFQDDGGTPMWRRRQAQIIIDATPLTPIERWRRLPFFQKAALILFAGWAMPFLILGGGLLFLALLTAAGL